MKLKRKINQKLEFISLRRFDLHCFCKQQINDFENEFNKTSTIRTGYFIMFLTFRREQKTNNN